MKFKLNEYTPSELKNEKIRTFLNPLPEDVVDEYASFLIDQPKLNDALTAYFDAPNNYPNIVPIVIYNELTHEVATLMANKNDAPEEPGEEGSILAFVRSNGYEDPFMCSDCYGQLSCSSCAVEVLTGTLENPVPREEEYDMLDIDESKPPTEKTRLGCQAKVGHTPLVVKIRAPEKKIISKI